MNIKMMLMFDIGTKIANVLTITVMLLFVGYIYSCAKHSAKYHILEFYLSVAKVAVLNYKPISRIWKEDKINSIIYLIIPVGLSVGLVLISQFYDGIYKIRYDFQILLGAALWSLLLMLQKNQYDLIQKLYGIIKDLKERLSKYE